MTRLATAGLTAVGHAQRLFDRMGGGSSPDPHPSVVSDGSEAEHPLRVLIVEDSVTFTEFLVGLFSMHSWVDVVGCAANGRAGVKLAEVLEPDLVLMDIEMPVMNGIDATRQIVARAPVPVFIVSASDPDAHQQAARDAGARALLPKTTDPAQLVRQLFALYRERCCPADDVFHGGLTAH